MKLVVCDDHRLILDTLGAALADLGYEVTTANHPTEALEAVGRVQPEVCLLDVNFPGASGLDVISRIRSESPGTKVIIFSADASDMSVRRAIAMGASGFVRKDRGLPQLVEAIGLAQSGHLAVEPRILQSAMRSGDPQDSPTWVLSFLTEREWQVLRCITDGLGTDEIATSLNVRRSTARTHVQNVLTKIGVHSRLQAVALVAAHADEVEWPAHVRPARAGALAT